MTGCPLPEPNANWALFLDIDGTLLDIADTPTAVVVPPELPALLKGLLKVFDNAVALISGRSLRDIDRLFAPLQLPAAGQHGAEIRLVGGAVENQPASGGLAALLPDLTAFVADRPGLLLEDKGSTIAVHYRHAPQYQPEIVDFLGALTGDQSKIIETIGGHRVFEIKPRAFIWISTDEVYGPVEAEDLTGHPEWAPILPSNPYSASKAAQEAIAISYWRTYAVPVVIVNCMNMIGERQDVEKYIPMVISKVAAGEEVTIHGTPSNIGTRHYLHARNLADAMCFIFKRETSPAQFHSNVPSYDVASADMPDRYNIASPDRIDNLTLARMIAADIGKRKLFANLLRNAEIAVAGRRGFHRLLLRVGC